MRIKIKQSADIIANTLQSYSPAVADKVSFCRLKGKTTLWQVFIVVVCGVGAKKSCTSAEMQLSMIRIGELLRKFFFESGKSVDIAECCAFESGSRIFFGLRLLFLGSALAFGLAFCSGGFFSTSFIFEDAAV